MSRVFAAGAPGREDEVPLPPAPGAQPFPSTVQSQLPPPDPTVDPYCYHESCRLPIFTRPQMLLAAPGECMWGMTNPPTVSLTASRPPRGGNGAARACLDSPPLTRQASPVEACTPLRCLHFLPFFCRLTPAVHEGLRNRSPGLGRANRRIRLGGV